MSPDSYGLPDLPRVLVSFCSLAWPLHLWRHAGRERAARAAAARIGLDADGPRAQHPHIDVTWCIGCGACVTACPEGDVLAVLGGKAAIVNGA